MPLVYTVVSVLTRIFHPLVPGFISVWCRKPYSYLHSQVCRSTIGKSPTLSPSWPQAQRRGMVNVVMVRAVTRAITINGSSTPESRPRLGLLSFTIDKVVIFLKHLQAVLWPCLGVGGASSIWSHQQMT